MQGEFSFQTHTPNFFSSLKIIHHSLNTPLTNLIINLELLSQNLNYQQQKINSQVYLQRCILSANYLRSISNQCATTFSKKIKKFCVKQSLLELIEICKNPKQQVLLVPFLQINNQLMLAGNKLYFQEAMICLLNNAFNAYKKLSPNKLVLLIAQQVNGNLVIKVTDSGQGFLELKDNSYSLISTSQIKNKHTGLNFVEQVIENHFHGKVLVQSLARKGTTVHCSFPLPK